MKFYFIIIDFRKIINNFNFYFMKKNLLKSLVILFSVSAMFYSCTSENSDPIIEESNKVVDNENPQIFQRNAGQVYEEYIDLFDSLYGTSFDVESTETYSQIEADSTEGTYYVTKVNLNNNLEGYFVDLPDRNVVYLEHNMSTGNLDYYDYDDVNDTMILTSYDLTLDSGYDYSHFSLERVNGPRKFWGTGSPICNDRYQSTSNGISWCMEYCYTPYYVFWLDVNDGSCFTSWGFTSM